MHARRYVLIVEVIEEIKINQVKKLGKKNLVICAGETDGAFIGYKF